MKIPFGKPLINKKEINNVIKVLQGTQLVHGPVAQSFEKEFSKFLKAKHCISLSSCTSGLHLSLHVNGIGHNDEVIVPAMTHVATAHAVEHVNAKPIFVDVDEETGNINSNSIKEKINSSTKAVIVVHYLGLPCEMTSIKKVTNKNNLKLIEDCALSLGAKVNHKSTGTIGDTGCFSFYPVKHITSAEGGMLATNNEKIAEKVRRNKAFGYDKNINQRGVPGIYDVIDLGYNFRMSEIQAAIGLAQLNKLENFLKIRKKNFNYMFSLLKDLDEIMIFKNKNSKIESSYYCLNVTLQKKSKLNRNEMIKYLTKQCIGVSVHYPSALPLFKYYKEKYGFKKGQFPISEWIAKNTISLPIAPHINFENINYIVKHLRIAISKKSNV